MAQIINTTLLSEGPKDAVLWVYLESDGTDGELVNYPILDPRVDFKQPLLPNRDQNDSSNQVLQVSRVMIMQAWISPSWFDIFLSTEGASPDQNGKSWVFARDADFQVDFRFFGGIKDFVAKEDGATGRLLISTKDFAPAGSKGTMILQLKKYLA